jgi:uncharacterized tellurite resistance protein B-like protein
MNNSKHLDERFSLEHDAEGNPTSQSLQIATVAVLHEAAKSSEGMSDAELARIVGALFREFGLSEHDGAQLFEVSEFLLKEAGKREEFIDEIRQKFAPVQRARVLSLIWRVIKADGVATKHEAQFAAEIRKKLDLPLEMALRAQQLSNPEPLDQIRNEEEPT